MPRPGPRPYECVRRAWHSDRHQPIRGSLIQEIFRVVGEVHSSATKRNKEWQEKLPIVVLKAEEIMYSKANSEAEYMDLTTLWDRANDAINIIIRRDDSVETCDLLQPCIEAALHLGCIPRRSSRSQRDNDPGRYLSPNLQKPMSSCHSNLKNFISTPPCMAMYSDVYNNAAFSQLEVPVDNLTLKNFPLRFPPLTSSSQSTAPETCRATVQGHSVYPLCHWRDDPQLHCNSLSLKKTGAKEINTPKKLEDTTLNFLPQTASHLSCDLSLRLGPSGGLDGIDKLSHHQEFQNSKHKKSSISTELHLFPNDGDCKYLNLNKAGQKRKALSLARTTPAAEEMICMLQPMPPRDRENPGVIKYPG